jgi:predicted RNA-binding Zn-ribbon protein involved in translation (DUF1610 family)
MTTVQKTYGPYMASCGRRRIMVVHYADGSRKTTAHARWVMEAHLGRELGADETVDHIDNDPMNDDLSNLQLLSMADNIRKSAKGIEMVKFSCPECGEAGQQEARNVRSNRRKGRAGPFCSRECAGRHNQRLRKRF